MVVLLQRWNVPWDSNPASGRWVPILALLQVAPGIGGANSWLARMKLVAGGGVRPPSPDYGTGEISDLLPAMRICTRSGIKPMKSTKKTPIGYNLKAVIWYSQPLASTTPCWHAANAAPGVEPGSPDNSRFPTGSGDRSKLVINVS